MDVDRFDRLTRSLTATPSRRGVSRALAGIALAGPLSALVGRTDAVAKKKGGKKKKKCKGGTKKCGKKCVAVTSCCGAADCGSGGACVDGTCFCPDGFKPCQGRCLPDDACCTNDDCYAGDICVQDQCVIGQGTCSPRADLCTSTDDLCGASCGCFATTAGQTRCGAGDSLANCGTCSSDTECAALFPNIPGVFCAKGGGEYCAACFGFCRAPCGS